MNQIINNLKSSITDASSAPKLLAGTGKRAMFTFVW